MSTQGQKLLEVLALRVGCGRSATSGEQPFRQPFGNADGFRCDINGLGAESAKLDEEFSPILGHSDRLLFEVNLSITTAQVLRNASRRQLSMTSNSRKASAPKAAHGAFTVASQGKFSQLGLGRLSSALLVASMGLVATAVHAVNFPVTPAQRSTAQQPAQAMTPIKTHILPNDKQLRKKFFSYI